MVASWVAIPVACLIIAMGDFHGQVNKMGDKHSLQSPPSRLWERFPSHLSRRLGGMVERFGLVSAEAEAGMEDT